MRNLFHGSGVLAALALTPLCMAQGQVDGVGFEPTARPGTIQAQDGATVPFQRLSSRVVVGGGSDAFVCYTDLASWTAAAGTPTHVEDFSGFTIDTPFEGAVVALNGSTITVSSGGVGFRNIVDVPPFQFGDNNGTNNCSSFTNWDEPTEITIAFASPVSAFGCEMYDALGLEMAEMVAMAGGSPVGVCAPASQGPAFAGFVNDSATITHVILRSQTYSPGSGGEGFGLDDLVMVQGGGASTTCYTDYATWLAAAGTPTHTEDFSGFTVDTPFDPTVGGTGPVALNGCTIEVLPGGGAAFRNIVDVPPFQFGDNNGTNNCSSFTNWDEPTEITIAFGSPVSAFGAAFSQALGLEMTEYAIMVGGTEIGVCAPNTNNIDSWSGFTTGSQIVTSVVLRSQTYSPGGGGEGFGLDNLAMVAGVPGCTLPIVYCTAGQGTSSSGCFASISTSNMSACPTSGANDYDVLVSNAEGAKPGIVFYGYAPAAIPFSSGTLCVQPPIKRTPAQSTGGASGSCNGSMTLRINDPAGVDHAAGTIVYFQGWNRDPMAAANTDVSDAIEIEYN